MEGLKRGDIVLCVAPGAYGKPRPAVVVQTDYANQTHKSIVVCPLTSSLQEAPLFRIRVIPSEESGLKKENQVMVDKIVALPREKLTHIIGRIDEDTVVRINRSIAFWLGLVA
ncbi:MAG: type II toxin-antitoxin system PemK/MazF family toxin [Desulfovermiculus sp.]